MSKTLIVIPARMGSTRYPGKPLVVIAGKTMIERVWRIAKAVPEADRVVIATESEQLRDVALGFGAEVVMTDQGCRTGTDRVAQTASLLNEKFDIVFSFQGDSPLTPPWVISDVVSAMKADPKVGIGTPARKLEGGALESFLKEKAKGSSSGTCVVFNKAKDALYFSKAVIPFDIKDRPADRTVYKHIGIYGYTWDSLFEFTKLEQTPFELHESLEQLRALENGIPIRVVPVDFRGRTPHSVDLPEDVAYVEQIIKREGELA